MANTGKGLPRSLKGVTFSASWAEITAKPTTFPPTVGTTATTAKAGNYVPDWAEITAKPTTFAPVAATTSVVGGVKQTPAVTNVTTQAVSGADAEAVATSATTAVNAIGTKLNALLAALRTAGVVTP